MCMMATVRPATRSLSASSRHLYAGSQERMGTSARAQLSSPAPEHWAAQDRASDTATGLVCDIGPSSMQLLSIVK